MFLRKLYILLLAATYLFAAPITIDDAQSVALELLNRRQIENKSGFSIRDYSTRERDENVLFYVFNFDPTGFVIVSADNRSKPILAYSFKNQYSNNNIPDHYNFWLGYYEEQIDYLIVEDIDQTEERFNEWREYLNPNPNQVYTREVVVEPLIKANWDQSNPYNGMCPGNPPTLVGCVAISMSQVMHYWKYPDHAVGNEAYTDPSGESPSFGYIQSNYGTSYDWDNMPNSGATEDTQRLLSEAGIAVHMDYDYDGSGSYIEVGANCARIALRQNFQYESTAGSYPSYRERNSYSETSWKNLLKNELNSGKPMIHDGCSTSGCHAWNIDGYDDQDYMHMNFGWGGSYNGYYSVDDISAGGDTYNQGLGVIEDINPADLSVPNLELSNINYLESGGSGDNDNVINPGEFGNLYITLENMMPWPEGQNLDLNLISNDPLINLTSDYIYIPSIPSSTTYEVDTPFSFYVNPNAEIKEYSLTLIINADGGYQRTFDLDFKVSLSQKNFPIDLSGQVKGSPIIADIDNNGLREVFIGDYLGVVHKYDINGNEDSTGVFPYDMGSDIWGSLAAADIDNDNFTDIIATSKSKHLVAFDRNGLKFDYDANSWLMGTPAIGQLDSDPELEIVVPGYSSGANRNIFAVNHDGTDVSGFPVYVGERTIVGVALHDFNNNGRDDIVFGTDSDNIHLMYDDGTIAWTYGVGDKIQSAPSIIDIGNGYLICAGSKDDNMYCLDESGTLAFSVETENDVFSSPSAVYLNSGVGIFFGSADGYIYGVNQNGTNLGGWPKDTGSSIAGSVSIADLDDDGSPEIIANNSEGKIFAYHLDGSDVNYFPITSDLTYTSSPQILDLDSDGDLEVFAGSSIGLEVFDIKTQGTSEGYWGAHRSNQSRTGYITSSDSGDCTAADVNGDSVIDILDIVQTVNIVMGFASPTAEQECAADINGDSIINILDIVTMANLILGG